MLPNKIATQETEFILHWIDAQIEECERVEALLVFKPNITDNQLGNFIKAIVIQELKENTTYNSLKDILCKFAANRVDWEYVGKRFKQRCQHTPTHQIKHELTEEQKRAMRY